MNPWKIRESNSCFHEEWPFRDKVCDLVCLFSSFTPRQQPQQPLRTHTHPTSPPFVLEMVVQPCCPQGLCKYTCMAGGGAGGFVYLVQLGRLREQEDGALALAISHRPIVCRGQNATDPSQCFSNCRRAQGQSDMQRGFEVEPGSDI